MQGTGNASATPDLLTVSVDIDVTEPSAQASLVDDNSKAAAVIAALKQGGVAAKDIQTSDVSIQPNYSLTGTITGYEMTNTLTAQLHDFSTAGSVIDAVAAAAGNAARIDSLTFSIQDPRQIEDRARNDAVHQAVSHARSMAAAAGERLGPVCSLTDDSSPDYAQPSPRGAAIAAGAWPPGAAPGRNPAGIGADHAGVRTGAGLARVLMTGQTDRPRCLRTCGSEDARSARSGVLRPVSGAPGWRLAAVDGDGPEQPSATLRGVTGDPR